MAGINFNDLPKNLQAKLEPYMTVAGSVENAIEAAKVNGKWTEADSKELSTLNGGANWGKTMDEVAFDSSKANEYKKMADAKKSSKKPIDFHFGGKSQAQLDSERAQLRRSIVEKRSQGITGYLSAMVDRVKLDMTPEKEGQQIAGGSLRWVAAAALAAVTVAFTSCQNDIDIGQNQAVYIPRTDYTQQINQIIERLDRLDNNNTAQLTAILKQLDNVIQNQNLTQQQLEVQLDAICQKLKGWLEQIIENQIDIKTNDNKNAQDILNAIMLIVNSDKDINAKLKDLMAILNQIKAVGESIDTTTKDILEEIKKAKNELIATLNTNNQEVLNAIAKLNENDQKSLAILNEIKNLINTYGSQGNAIAEAILIAVGKINSTDLSGVEALLNKLVKGQKKTNDEISDLTNLFSKFSSATATQLNTIIAKLDKSSPNYDAQLNAIIKLLEQLDANNDTRNQKVLDAISKLGADVSGSLTAILAAIQSIPAAQQKDYSDVLNAILDKIKEGNSNNNKNFKAVLDAIAKLGVDVAYGFNTILDAIKNQPDYSAKLDAIIAKLNSIGDGVTANGNTLKDILKAIKDHDVKVTVDVTGKVQCECNCNCGNGGVHEGILGDLNDLLG